MYSRWLSKRISEPEREPSPEPEPEPEPEPVAVPEPEPKQPTHLKAALLVIVGGVLLSKLPVM